jgi:hypothetical protein
VLRNEDAVEEQLDRARGRRRRHRVAAGEVLEVELVVASAQLERRCRQLTSPAPPATVAASFPAVPLTTTWSIGVTGRATRVLARSRSTL